MEQMIIFYSGNITETDIYFSVSAMFRLSFDENRISRGTQFVEFIGEGEVKIMIDGLNSLYA